MSEDEGAEAAEAESATAESAGDERGDEPGRETASESDDDELVERVAESDPAEIARELATLREERDALEADLESAEERAEDLESKLKRERADFQNYKKRQERRREEERQRATEDLVERLLDVRDNLRRALDQDENVDVREGVETTLEGFDRVLEDENVDPIEPTAGDEVDPERHEVLTRVEADQPEGTVADCYRPGYAMAGKVLRPAQVTVSE